MIHRSIIPTLFILLTITLSSCSAIADIFQAGIWVGIIMVVLIVGLIGFLISRFRR